MKILLKTFSYAVCVITILFLVNNVSGTDVDKLILAKEAGYTVCPMKGHHCSKEELIIKVSAATDGVLKSDERFYFIPSGGTVIGSGADVVWDLSEASPGKYSITAGIGKNDIISGKTITRSFVVTECSECDPPHDCPNVALLGPVSSIRVGQSFIVRGKFAGDLKGITFKWKAEGAAIIDGGSNLQILVKAPAKAGSIRIVLEVDGLDPSYNCVTGATQIFTIEDR